VTDEAWHTSHCPAGCPEARRTLLPLHHRRLVFGHCQACRRLWLEGPEGQVRFSHREFAALLTLLQRFLAGQLNL
jgi:hypothetical protein